MLYGYARVSSSDQNPERQIAEFLRFGVEEKHIYCDKKSGKDFCREAYMRLCKRLRRGDVLVLKSIDRLGRNYRAIVEEWRKLADAGVQIVVIDMPLLDTRNKDDSLMGRFISDLVLEILSFVAENERANIRARQAEGIALAKARGVHMGRPPRTFSERSLHVFDSFSRRELSLSEAARQLELTRQTFLYHFRKFLSGDIAADHASSAP